MLADTSIPSLYEAAVNFESIRARFDVLVRRDGRRFDLVEVKSSTGVKAEHITDVAIQLYAAEGSGIAIERAYLMHLNREYVYQGGEYDLEQLFTLADVTEQSQGVCVAKRSGSVGGDVGNVGSGLCAGDRYRQALQEAVHVLLFPPLPPG